MVRRQKNYGAAIAQIATCIALFFAAVAAQAQTLTVLHNFTRGADGGWPFAGVTLDQQGRIYGTAYYGGSQGVGAVYRLVREGEGWVFSPLYSFGSQENDGQYPSARVLFGPDGLLYGTTYYGGSKLGGGTVFSLQPPAAACKSALCPWVETVIHSFEGGSDGAFPGDGDLTFDQAGNIYGTTLDGGSADHGVVFKLTRSGGGWTESVLWNFTGYADGSQPFGRVIFDNAGNLYGTTSAEGSGGYGTVYELSPTQSGWNETTLYSFTYHDNGTGSGGLTVDAHGDLLGMTGNSAPGAAYELTQQNGSWSYTLLQAFTGGYPGPYAAPTFDSQGNLYGALPAKGDGEIFRLTPSGNQWLYSSFYQFTDGGVEPFGVLMFDASGNLYGTTVRGGTYGEGTVWEITP
jgi:uncharacterized repeat protein (TIGR03803 family)